jgi:UDP-glucose:(heptosyl)LPS alpha-1,3-glucosyltransferase
MRIGLIRRRFAVASGAELYVQRLLSQLVQTGHEIHLVSEYWPCAPEGVTVHRVEGSSSRGERIRAFADAVERQLASLDLDCTLSLERTRKQTIFRAGDGVHQAWLDERRKFSPWWKKPFIGVGKFNHQMNSLESAVYNPQNTGIIIANSNMVKQDIERYYGFPSDSIRIIRNGVDSFRMASADRDDARKRFGLKHSEFVICFVGSGWERKGLPFVIEAVKRIGRKNVRLIVAGKGRPPMCIPSNITFLGPVEDVEMVYAASDLMMTLPIYEPCANVVTEALCAGLPVITTRRNGAAELLEDGLTGSVVQSGDRVDEIVQALTFWIRQARGRVRVPDGVLEGASIERNSADTLSVILQQSA